jgi:hypothetical protein
MSNVVRLDDNAWMVIDLEHCRLAADPLPASHSGLADWDAGTTEAGASTRRSASARYYTKLSDMYQIGGLLKRLIKPTFSDAASQFAEQLRRRELDAAAALCHAWLCA